jgi:hypothetical protein
MGNSDCFILYRKVQLLLVISFISTTCQTCCGRRSLFDLEQLMPECVPIGSFCQSCLWSASAIAVSGEELRNDRGDCLPRPRARGDSGSLSRASFPSPPTCQALAEYTVPKNASMKLGVNVTGMFLHLVAEIEGFESPSVVV